jgi:tetratricopeptide (TPR) repeat protein
MGLFSWFSPSPEKRLARARRALQVKDWALARDYARELEGEEPADILRQARAALVVANLDAAVSWANTGDEERIRVHLDLAAEHHDGGLEDAFRDARRQIRELREAQRAEAEDAKRRHDARTLSVDPLHLGGNALTPPRTSDELVGPDTEELRARLALVVENYPDALRARAADLGAPFASAVIDVEDGRPDLALQALLLLPDDEPLVRWERARCAYGLGDARAAARELARFAELAGGHHPIGRTHSGLMLAQTLAESGDAHAGLRALRDLRARDPKLGGFLMAQLLASTDQLPEADAMLRELIRQNPLESTFYKLLAFVRVRGGQRVEAMRALEQGLHQNACASGTCSARPADPESKRLLAMLYLEDGLETRRALALLDEAPHEGPPSWDDRYIDALVARARGDQQALGRLIEQLRAATPADDPRAERLTRLLPLSA